MQELEADCSWNARMLGELSVTVVTIIMNSGILEHGRKQGIFCPVLGNVTNEDAETEALCCLK